MTPATSATTSPARSLQPFRCAVTSTAFRVLTTPRAQCTVGNYAKSRGHPVGKGRALWTTPRSYCPDMPRTPPNLAALQMTLVDLDAGRQPARERLRDAVRGLLSVLEQRAPGRTVEVRVPPYGAIQCIAGPRHTRGTPPNVIETDPVTWVTLATGRLDWAAAVASGRVRASGNRADLAPVLPLLTDNDLLDEPKLPDAAT